MCFKEIDRILRENGWSVVRINGSHYQYRHPEHPGLVTVPNHGSRDLSRGTLGSIKRQSGLSFR